MMSADQIGELYEHSPMPVREVARLAVPDVADWCAIDIVQPDGTTRQVKRVNTEPELEEVLLEVRRG